MRVERCVSFGSEKYLSVNRLSGRDMDDLMNGINIDQVIGVVEKQIIVAKFQYCNISIRK